MQRQDDEQRPKDDEKGTPDADDMRAVLARHTHELVSRPEVRALACDRGLAGRQTRRRYHGPTLLTHVGRSDV